MAKKASSKLSSIDYSKRAKGQSKREYAAQALGGKLDYKSGKISVPAKTTKKTYSQAYTPSLSGDDADMGYIGTPEYQQYLNENNGKAMPNEEYNTKNLAYNTNKAKTKGISVDTNQRLSAADYIRRGLGINTAEASGGYNPKPVGGGIKGWIKSNVTDLINFRNQSNDFGRSKGIEVPFNKDWHISETLGIPQQNIIGESQQLNPNYTPSSNNFDVLDRVTQDDVSVLNDIFNQTNTDYTNPNDKVFNQPTTDNVYQSPNNNDNQRSSRQVSNPTPIFQPAQSSNISSILSPQSAPQDFSNNAQSIDPTRKLLGGRGYFSNGIASNGAGNYGIEGAMTGTDQVDPNSQLDDILTFFGLKPQTAMAAEPSMFAQTLSMPSMFNQPPANSTGYSAQNGGMSTMYGTDVAPVFQQRNSGANQSAPDYNPMPQQQNGGGVSQQYAATNPATQYYQDAINGYGSQQKDTEKAYKKALKEMLKGIESQYKTQQTTGTNELNKQKVNDLQALASRFSFGLNQDPNSEQAVQYAQRTQNDYAGQLSDFLAKLAAAKTQDISQARSGNQSQLMQALQSIQTNRSSAQEKLAELLYKMQSSKSGGTKANYKQVGVNAQNQPVYRDFNTGQEWVGEGLTPTLGANPQLQQDENGDWYYEQ